ncbi:GNAT family N-acetyltransferase [Staphylococcus arlettae]|uniref:GNAT family N-acetyltransferase n=1 Tax=Staphylococcus arlettae TaxID=29378 RepID=UPI003EE1D5CA
MKLILENIDDQTFKVFYMECLEEYCKNKRVESIALHVLGHNKRAVSLYNKMGFETTNYRMEKKLK